MMRTQSPRPLVPIGPNIIVKRHSGLPRMPEAPRTRISIVVLLFDSVRTIFLHPRELPRRDCVNHGRFSDFRKNSPCRTRAMMVKIARMRTWPVGGVPASRHPGVGRENMTFEFKGRTAFITGGAS